MSRLDEIKNGSYKVVDYSEYERELNRQKRAISDRVKAERRKSAARAELKKLKAQNEKFDKIISQISSLSETYDGIIETYRGILNDLDAKHKEVVSLYNKSGVEVLESLGSGLEKINGNTERFESILQDQLKALEVRDIISDSHDKLASSLSDIINRFNTVSKSLSELPKEFVVDLSKVEKNLDLLISDNEKEWTFDIERDANGLISKVNAWQTM